MPIRAPLIVTVGHVDHGKTKILDKIRQSRVQSKEAGGITQHIGASFIPIKVIKNICGDFLSKIGANKITIPGLLMIDTPGHEAFTSLRERGGSIADLAILVIDVTQGLQPQTVESIQILKQFKVPFVIAANKIDLISGWKPYPNSSFLNSFSKQSEFTKELLNMRLMEIIGAISEFGFESERFDKIKDFTKQIAIIPTSALTGEGIIELLAILTGLSQKYLENNLKIEVSGPGKGTILEVKEEKGLGKTIDVIVYDGTIKKKDTVIIAGINKPIVTKIKALLKPKPLQEIREKSKFEIVDSVSAAAGIKIAAPNLDEVIPGMPLMVINEENIKDAEKEIQKSVKKVIFETDDEGITVKADSIGSLEALIGLLKRKNIPVRKAGIGDVNKSDILSVKNNPDHLKVIFGFNVKSKEEDKDVKIFISKIVYKLIEDYEQWKNELVEKKKKEEIEKLTKPAKIRILPGYIFRQSKPAVVGVEILKGTLTKNVRLINTSGKIVGLVKEIQDKGESLQNAQKGLKVAISIEGASVGKNIYEDQELFVNIPESDYKKVKNKLHPFLDEEFKELYKKVAEIKRKQNIVWEK